MRKFRGFSKVGVVVGVLLAAFVGVVTYLVVDANSKTTNFNDYDFYSIIEPDEHNGYIGDHVKGNPEAPTVIYEYADYQCPGCASISARVQQAVDESDGQLAVVYRSYLLSYHQNGTAAASAAEAAGLQGHWEEYATKLFDEQTEWEYASPSERTTLFDKYFDEVTGGKGDLDQFHDDIASERVSKKISFDMGIGKRVGITGTPSFYINGQKIDWSNSEGSHVTLANGETVAWESAVTGEGFPGLLLKIAEVNAGERQE